MHLYKHYQRIATLPLLLISFVSLPLSMSAAAKPNVIVVMADDQGSIDTGCYGAGDLLTPAVDSLAARGVHFTQFYSAAPVCSPSRAGLLTGRYPWIAGMPSNAAAPPVEAADRLDTFTGEGLPPSEVTMAEIFKAAGYSTAHIGKWHLGYAQGHKPLDQGFDYSFGFMGGCIDNYTHFFYWAGPNRHDLWENNRRVRLPGRFFPDLMVERATAYIASHRDRPFFMYFAVNVPHYPYQGDAKWLEHYKNLPYPRSLYAAFVSTLDERVHRMIQFLDDTGLRENTIVVYQSDNGHSVEVRAHNGGGNSGPYRGAKFSVFEGGIRLPAIISWPGHLPEGAVRSQVVHSCDWLPTLAALCEVPLPNSNLSGRNIVPVIESATAKSPHDALFWRSGKQWAVRKGPWKLLHNPDDRADANKLAPADKEWFLANVDSDPGEQTNLVKREPEMFERLRSIEANASNRGVK